MTRCQGQPWPHNPFGLWDLGSRLHELQLALKPLRDKGATLVHPHPTVGPVRGRTPLVLIPRLRARAGHSLREATAHPAPVRVDALPVGEDRVADSEEVRSHAVIIANKLCFAICYFHAN